MPVRARDELHRHTEPVARALKAPLHDGVDPQLSRRRLGGDAFLLVAENGGGRTHHQRLDEGQLGDRGVRETESQIGVLRTSLQVPKREDGDRRAPRERRLRAAD